MSILTHKNFVIEITGFLNFTGIIKTKQKKTKIAGFLTFILLQKQKTYITGFLTFTGIN